MPGHRILLVDDEKSLRQLVGNSLRHAGYEVDVAASGDEALQIALANPPELILTDIMMPNMDGYELVRRLRAEGIGSYIIFLTARGGSADLIKGFDVEADDYLVKPFQMPELLARIKAGIRLRDTQQNLALANQRLKQALTQRDDLISLIAHDLRNPIHVINSYAQIIGSDTLPTDTIRSVCLRRSEEMLRLINNVTEMGNVEKHRMRFNPARMNLSLLLRERMYVYEPILEQREVGLRREIAEDICVFSDARKVSEVADSCLLAAVQLAESGGALAVRLADEGGRATFRVEVSTAVSDSLVERMLVLIEGGRGWNDGLDASTHLGLMVASRIMRILGGDFSVGRRADGTGLALGFALPGEEADSLEAARQRVTDAGGTIG